MYLAGVQRGMIEQAGMQAGWRCGPLAPPVPRARTLSRPEPNDRQEVEKILLIILKY